MNTPTTPDVALREFVRWVITEGPFMGGDLDGFEVQERAEKLGLIVPVPGGYDPKVHGEGADADPGDPYFVFAPFLLEPTPK